MTTETRPDTRQNPEGRGHPSEIHFTVDGEPCHTHRREMTPNDIIREFAEKDPATHYLVEIHGHHKTSYEGQGDIPIKLRDGMRFQVISTGPTPVSADGHANR